MKQLSTSGYELYAFTKSELDITDAAQVAAVCDELRPNVIINAAAYTNLDGEEANPELAFQVNAIGQRNLAVAAEKIAAKICYVSTDYVFNGQASSPYNEYSNVEPLLD
ncbi:MAG TPA: NAD(P)-dependent oxidoreductase [Candidatus Paenibacillus intestinavium]|nr:NAD(P)-dependent oxidoreductase [Candidatus Paenibacillus intestinavium]